MRSKEIKLKSIVFVLKQEKNYLIKKKSFEEIEKLWTLQVKAFSNKDQDETKFKEGHIDGFQGSRIKVSS